MISPESPLFTIIATAVREAFPDSYVAGEYVSQPPRFPAVNIVEMDNFPVRSTMTNVSILPFRLGENPDPQQEGMAQMFWGSN